MRPERHLKAGLSELLKHPAGIGELLWVKVEFSIVGSVAVIQLQMGACEAMLADVRSVT